MLARPAEIAPPAPGSLRTWWPFLIVVAVYALAGSREIDLPGVYMDAVNPDYMVARILGPGAAGRIPGWTAPGNDLMHRFPVLVGLHHGSAQFWLGLPLFALFGTTVTGLRWVHMCFGLGVLAGCYWLLVASGVRRSIATVACVGLALEPAFIFAFRTQSYITMAPFALVMLAVWALLRARAPEPDRASRWLATSGVFAGFACWGYFIYGFFVPAFFVAVASLAVPLGRMRGIATFALGVTAGAALYIVGYAIMWREMGSLGAAWTHVITIQPGLGVTGGPPVSLAQRYAHLVDILDMVLTNSWHRVLMFGEDKRGAAEHAKGVALVLVPIAGWIVLEAFRAATWTLRMLMGLLVSYFLVAMVFGTRLAGHHLMPVVPLLYVSLALVADAVLARFRFPGTRAVVVAAATGLVALNVTAQARDFATLRQTGGTGNYSDAINRLALDLVKSDGDDFLAFPDWGLFMPMALLTHGRYETDAVIDADRFRRALCKGRDVVVGLIEGDRAARIRALQDTLRWSAPEVIDYRQRDGKIVFSVARFKGDRSGAGCGQ